MYIRILLFSKIVMPVKIVLSRNRRVLCMWMPARSFPNTSCLCIRGACHQLSDLVFLPAPENFHIDAVSQVFHRFAKHRVVHQLVKVCFKLALHFSKLCIHPDVQLLCTHSLCTVRYRYI